MAENRKVALEDLLRLKRAERPDPEFWDRFEQDLRTRQLAAIVARRPWWHLSFSQVARGLVRARLPLGATAVLALSFFTVREYRNPQVETNALDPKDVAAGAPVPVASGVEALPMVSQVASSVQAVPEEDATIVAAVTEASHPVQGGERVNESRTSSSSVAAGMIPWVGDAALVASAANSGSSGPTVITATLATVSSVMTGFDEDLPLVASRRSAGPFNVRSTPTEPLVQVASQVGGGRRDWLATYVTAMDRDDDGRKSVSRVRERTAGRLSEDQLYNKFGRLGVAGGGLNLSF